MHFKYSALAASLVAALTLSGCNDSNSDSSSDNAGVDTGTPKTDLVAKPNIAIPTQGQFVGMTKVTMV